MATDASSASAGESVESLSQLFYRVQRACVQEGTRSAVDAAALRTQLIELTQLIQQAALFSTNEEADDLSTGSLKYMLVPYYSGSTESSYPGGVADRLPHLSAAFKHYAEFIKRMEDYKLVAEKDEIAQFKEFQKQYIGKITSSSGSASAAPAPKRPMDPNAARTAKIARFKREKEIKEALQLLQQQRRARVKASSSSSTSQTIGSAAANDDTLDEESADSHSDEESVRAFYKTLFQSLVLSCVDFARSACDEADMLAHFRDVESRLPKQHQLANMSPEERAAQASQGANKGAKPVMMKMTPESLFQPIPDHMKHLLQNVAVPANSAANSKSASSSSASSSVIPSTVNNRIDAMVKQRATAREDVFKLTNQPTYSIEQWAEMEIAAGHMPGPNTAPPPKPEDPRRIRSAADREVAEELVAEFQKTQMEDSDELGHEDGAAGAAKDELKTMKDREWDNWKDDHQKGVGNSIK